MKTSDIFKDILDHFVEVQSFGQGINQIYLSTPDNSAHGQLENILQEISWYRFRELSNDIIIQNYTRNKILLNGTHISEIQRPRFRYFRAKSSEDRNSNSNQDHDRSGSAENLLEHIRESYDFVWNANAPLMLEDSKDSIIYGQLVVSPPPSG